MSDHSIKHKAGTSLLWSSIEQFGSQGLSLIITIAIARIITPEDYGLIAMLSIFMALSQVFINSGFSNYLIQNKHRTECDYSTVFFLNVAIGITCYILLFFLSHSIANFYNQPILENIVKVYSTTLIISSFTLVQRTILYIEFKFRKLSFITIISLLISGSLAIVLAKAGYGVWTLVYYNIAQTSIASILIWATTRWHPHLIFSSYIAKKAFSFGSKLLGANILSVGVSNLYTLVIGKKFQAIELGYYSRGQSLAYVFPSNFANMFQQATYPVFCELQDDISGLKRMFENYIILAASICFPLMTPLAGIAEPLVKILLTDKWLPAVPFLQILAIAYMFDPIMRLNSIILSVTGKTQLSLYSEIIKKLILITILFASIPLGIKWVTAGVIIYSIADMITVSLFVNRIIPFSFLHELKLIYPYFLFSCIILGGILVIDFLIKNDVFNVFASIALSICIYISLVYIFKRKQYDFIITYLHSITKRTHG